MLCCYIRQFGFIVVVNTFWFLATLRLQVAWVPRFILIIERQGRGQGSDRHYTI